MRKYESWAQAIVSERKRARKTQSELGELCGVNPANLRKYESGRQNPKYETVERIAQALGVQMWKNKEIYVQDEGKRDVRNCDMPQEVADWLERFVPWARHEIAKAGDDNDGICTIADGHSEHQNIMVAAYLLGTMLADVQEECRNAEYNGAIMKVDEIIRECGRKDGGDDGKS